MNSIMSFSVEDQDAVPITNIIGSKEAKAIWKRMVPELKAMGVLTAVDGEALASFCQAYVRWREAEDFLTQHGSVYPLRDEHGRVRCMQQFPQVSIARNLLLILKAFYQEFGMTPASRSRIEVPLDPRKRNPTGLRKPLAKVLKRTSRPDSSSTNTPPRLS